MNKQTLSKSVKMITLFALVLFTGSVSLFGNEKTIGKESSPNVLFIIADDLNDALRFMGGHPQSYTPNLDRLAQRGMTFSSAYTNCPLCNPSRVSLWTGMAPWRVGLYENYGGKVKHWREYNGLLSEAVTMQEHFKANGYEVYGTGKVFHSYGRDNLPGIWTDHGNRLGFYPTPGTGGKNNRRCGHPSMPCTFDDDIYDLWMSCGPLSDVPDVPPDPKRGTPGYKGWIMGGGVPFRYIDEDDRDLMPDEQSAQYIIDLLDKDHDKPFMAICGFFRPHEPLYAPKKYFDMFPVEDIILPAAIENDLEDVPEILWNNPAAKIDFWKRPRFLKMIEKGGVEMWKKWVQSYLACCAFVDDQIGQILDALDNSEYADNTIIVFTSDHGYNMGEKETIFKYTLWEESARVPFIISTPEINDQHPGECTKPVSLLDLYPTLIDLCGLPGNPNENTTGELLGGYSLKPLLIDPSGSQWIGPPVATTVIASEDPFASLDKQHISVRSERWRFTLCADGEEELYDHLYDPNEWTNLASNKDYENIKHQHKKYILELLDKVSANKQDN